MLVLFSELEKAVGFGDAWYGMLPPIRHDPAEYREQFYVDEASRVVGRLEWYLGASARVSLYELEKQAHAFGALVIPAHVDAVNYSLLHQLGTVPPLPWDALEFLALPARGARACR